VAKCKVPKIAQQPISLETPVGEQEDSHLGDFIADRAVVSPAEAVINVNLKDQTGQGPAHADPPRRRGNQGALRTGGGGVSGDTCCAAAGNQKMRMASAAIRFEVGFIDPRRDCTLLQLVTITSSRV
jgi:hypothetical protein